MSNFKKCSLCGEVKPLTEFYKRASMKDGHRSECKVCNDAKRAERRNKTNPVNDVVGEVTTISKNSIMLNIVVFVISFSIVFAIVWSLS